MTKHYLVVCDHSPYGGLSMRESLDIATAAAAFDLPVHVLLRGDAVYGALAGQDSQGLEQKSIAKQLEALVIYGVTAILADSNALAERQLDQSELLADIQPVGSNSISALYDAAEIVVQL